jgi:hypothetical protein
MLSVHMMTENQSLTHSTLCELHEEIEKRRAEHCSSKSDTHKSNGFFAELNVYQKLMNANQKRSPQSDTRLAHGSKKYE